MNRSQRYLRFLIHGYQLTNHFFHNADDQDEAAINKRHDIYYDDKTGTLAAAHYFKALAEKGETKYIVLNGQGTIDSIKETLIKELGLN